MRLRDRAATIGVLLSLVFAVSANAEESRTSVVWYRASEECPAGAVFLGKLAAGVARARLADAGDHIDFVVTLVAGRGETVGRLERQTQGGTVAIRELRDVSCERVADALALSLGLALDPGQPTAAPAPDVSSEPGASAPSPIENSPQPTESVVGASDSLVPKAVPARIALPLVHAQPAPPVLAQEPNRWSVGFAGGVLFGVSPDAMPLGALFANVDRPVPTLAPDLALRLAVVGAFDSPATAVGPVKQWLVAGQGEVCPWRWGGTRIGLRPCAELELGLVGASDSRSTGQQASAIWAAPGLGLRAGARLLPNLMLEVGADALFPLARSELDAGDARLYRGDFTALCAQLGVSIGPF